MKNEMEQIESAEALAVKRWGEEFNRKRSLNCLYDNLDAESLLKSCEDYE